MEQNINKDRKERLKQTDPSMMVYGKVPPQAKEMEEAILGACMIQSDAVDRTVEILRPEMFYVEAHQRIYNAIVGMSKNNRHIDTLTVAEELRKSEELEMTGGSYYLSKLTTHVVSSAHIESHSQIVLQKFIQREVIRISGELIHSAYEDSTDAFELLEEAEQSIGEISSCFHFGDMIEIDRVLVDAIREIERNRNNDSTITGIPSGFNKLDQATRGWQNSDLIILAARPSVGKTAFALNLVRNASMHFQQLRLKNTKDKKYVAVWSLEMKVVKLVMRMLASESKELLYRIQTGRLSEDQMKNIYKKGVQVLSQALIKFDDKPGLTIPKLKSKARKMKRKGELGMIVIDYMQLITPSNVKAIREQQVSEISRELKNLAAELDVPIIALSQLSRGIESRKGEDRVPQLSDLRESGAIEQDADVVMFLWGPDENDIKDDVGLKNTRYIRVAKQRDGFLIKLELDFRDEIQFFSEINNLPDLPAGNWRPVVDVTQAKEKDDEDPF